MNRSTQWNILAAARLAVDAGNMPPPNSRVVLFESNNRALDSLRSGGLSDAQPRIILPHGMRNVAGPRP